MKTIGIATVVKRSPGLGSELWVRYPFYGIGLIKPI